MILEPTVSYKLEVTDKELRVIGLCLAGKKLSGEDEKLAAELNGKLTSRRAASLKELADIAARAAELAEKRMGPKVDERSESI